MNGNAAEEPEVVLAQYLQILQQPDPDLKKAMNLHNSSDDIKRAAQDVSNDHDVLVTVRDVKFNRRYDIGNYTFISALYEEPDGKLLPSAFYAVHKSQVGYRVTLQGIDPLEPSVGLFFYNDYNLYNLGLLWNRAPQPIYKYSFNFPSPFPSDDPHLHPLTIFFNGRPSDIPINPQAGTPGPISTFVKQVVQTYRTGTRQQWLNLWTSEDVKETWGKPDGAYSNSSGALTGYSQERSRFNGANVALVFTIDFGPNAVVFLADESKPSAPLSYLLLWKGSSQQYHLTIGVTLKSGEDTFSGNISDLFTSSPFKDYVKSIVQPIPAKPVK